MEGSGQRRRAHRTGGAREPGPRADRSCRFAWSVRALAGIAHQPSVRGPGPAGPLGDAPGTPPGRTRDGQRDLASDRVVAAGLHVSAVGLRRVKRRDRSFSLSCGLSLAGTGSGTRVIGHATDPFAFDGRADLLLPRRRFAGVRGTGCFACRQDRVAGASGQRCPFPAALADAEAGREEGSGDAADVAGRSSRCSQPEARSHGREGKAGAAARGGNGMEEPAPVPDAGQALMAASGQAGCEWSSLAGERGGVAAPCSGGAQLLAWGQETGRKVLRWTAQA
jgi:hypothetical protein